MVDKIRNIWSRLEKKGMPSYAWSADPLTFWRERILFLMCFICATFGSIALVPSLVLSYREDLMGVMVLDAAVYLAVTGMLVFRDLPLRVRGAVIFMGLYSLGIGLLFSLGHIGAGYIWLFGASVMAGVFLGMGAAFGTLVLNMLTMVAIGIYIGIGSPFWAAGLDNPLEKWSVMAVNFMLLNFFVTIATAFILNGLKKALVKEQQISSDLRLSEDRLRLHQKRFLTVLDSIDASIFVTDLKGYDILFMNKHMIDEFGDDLTGRKCWEAMKGETGPCRRCTKHEQLDDEGDSAVVSVWQEQNPKTKKWTVNHSRVIRWPDGRLVKIQVATDISELKKLEADLRQSQKMEAIGTLAGGIAHDFNNILSAILGFTELAIEDSEKGSSLEENLNEVMVGVIRARELVKQILTFSRQSGEGKKPLRAKAVAKEAMRLIRSTIPSSITIRQEMTGESTIVANPAHIHQILMNLCNNAAHAMEKTGGILTVSLSDVTVTPSSSAAHESLPPGAYLMLKVSDTGTGIEPEIQETIFEPFFTTKEPGEGTGMGLSTIYGIVQESGGKIAVDSRPRKGTVFTIYFPAVNGFPEKDESSGEVTAGGSEHILLVDDEQAITKMGTMILERLGYSVTARSSSLEALAHFSQNPDLFDLVITDMTMPGMNGGRFAAEVMRIRPDMPIIMCTGYNTTVDSAMAEKVGIKAFFEKPIEKQALALTIRKVLDGA